jgi:hypothetical protein
VSATVESAIDAKLLYETILPSIGNNRRKRILLRKGIGWALRERSYDCPRKCWCSAVNMTLSYPR